MKEREETLPDGPLLAFLGDDFTGSTDAMEVFAAAGISTVLFLEPPEAHWIERFAGMQCIGLATTARSQTPDWMDDNLTALFRCLVAFKAPILHYKVCSTFDSSPITGSIGRAIDIGTRVMSGRWSPMIIGAPRLRRYQAFGNLFAIADGTGFRLDRHPTMSRHPVTPMKESDLARHLAGQTQRRIELIDLTHLKNGTASARLEAFVGPDNPVIMLDVLDDDTQAEAGRLVWQNRGEGVFSASSSGLQYALVAHWRLTGLLPKASALPKACSEKQIIAVSGSCSPVTARQIAAARQDGFVTIRLAIPVLLERATRAAEIQRVVGLATKALSAGMSPLIFSAEGPDDPAVTDFDEIIRHTRLDRETAAAQVGQGLGTILRELLDLSRDIKRIVVAGGDSSGAVAKQLDITALSVEAELAPGAPLCRCWSDRKDRDGLQIVLKGGQMGGAGFFGDVRAGHVRAI